uniref:Uncharacterized protein n=1 Tax=Rangifer tarandus platyrhynchus TaxID=3082113 RepID=A0ACB0DZH0_RANTA|nr:unnamed protein product [Rangifer tarandus platyrhynchus]
MKAKVLESRKVVMGPWARPVRPRAKGQMSSCSGAFGCPVNRGLSELQPAWLTWPAVESQGPGARVCVFLHIRALQRSPRHLSVQDPVLEAVNTGWSGERTLPWLVMPPAAPRAERTGVEAASFQDEEGSSAALPDARGVGQVAENTASHGAHGGAYHGDGQQHGPASSKLIRAGSWEDSRRPTQAVLKSRPEGREINDSLPEVGLLGPVEGGRFPEGPPPGPPRGAAAAGPRLPDPGVAPFVRPQWARPAARPRLIGARAAAATPAPPRTWAPAGPRTPDLGTPARIRSRRALGHWAPDPDPCSDPDPCLPDPPQTGSKTPSHVDPATAPLPTRCGPQAPDIELPAGPGPAWRRRTRPPSLQGHADPPGGE